MTTSTRLTGFCHVCDPRRHFAPRNRLDILPLKHTLKLQHKFQLRRSLRNSVLPERTSSIGLAYKRVLQSYSESMMRTDA